MVVSIRFIPACAGNTAAVNSAAHCSAVHPRVRGEHAADLAAFVDPDGSSPRARGTLTHRASHSLLHRFIPACAGNTSCLCPRTKIPSVHPRVRGEHAFAVPLVLARAGSSPRARGTRGDSFAVGAEGRFIPACAGNTTRPARLRFATPVHPRVRGEHFGESLEQECIDGSSPRARGTPTFPTYRYCIHRFIPACAGNTSSYRTTHKGRPVHPRVRGEHFSSGKMKI